MNIQTIADSFGLMFWIFLIVDGLYQLTMYKKKKWRMWLELIAGLLGFAVDGYFVAIGLMGG